MRTLLHTGFFAIHFNYLPCNLEYSSLACSYFSAASSCNFSISFRETSLALFTSLATFDSKSRAWRKISRIITKKCVVIRIARVVSCHILIAILVRITLLLFLPNSFLPGKETPSSSFYQVRNIRHHHCDTHHAGYHIYTT